MLYYNVYNNISDRDFLEIRSRLIVLEEKMFEILRPFGWELTGSISKNDGLIVDFIIDEELFMGNMGVEFEDKPHKHLFSFYVTKSFDEGNKRFFLRNIPCENKELSFYEENIDLIVNESLRLYEHWDKNSIYNNGIVVQTG